ncbi:hypothetical protein GUJ93_ZPchr0012g18891 [Zizania palustris]|uniref:C3H1-type domain-containing protein n=1 Tax=Zizania palustris TaxID=103762 RepID=A0A8J5WQE0_ZIZPA|nr:hypothetical protein GUJ93_ZPchr0012g18891 [Zizania palustris]
MQKALLVVLLDQVAIFSITSPGGYQAVANMTTLGGPAVAAPSGRMPLGPGAPNGPPTVKTRMCNKYNTAEGCKWGNKCHFAHGERELGKPMQLDNSMPHPMVTMPNGHFEPPRIPGPDMVSPSTFGASATAKISIDASLAGVIIGKGGVNTKHISRMTGTKLAIRDNEFNANLKNIELEGTFDQIKHASAMVTELIVRIGGVISPMVKVSYANRLLLEKCLPLLEVVRLPVCLSSISEYNLPKVKWAVQLCKTAAAAVAR